jgi:hypothetical protein
MEDTMTTTAPTPTGTVTTALTGRRFTAEQDWDSGIEVDTLSVGDRAHAYRTTYGVGVDPRPRERVTLIAEPRWEGVANNTGYRNLGLVEVVKVLKPLGFGGSERYQVRRVIEAPPAP